MQGTMESPVPEPKTGIVVQSRMGSTRLPGKILKELVDGESVLGYLLGRLSTCQRAGALVVATTDSPKDDILEEWLKENGYAYFRGSEPDCLDRYAQLVHAFGIDVVVRVTADCPLVVPEVVDGMLDYYMENRSEIGYLSNRQYTNFPEGLDVEIFTRRMLDDASAHAALPKEREHINYYFLDREADYRIRYYNHALGKDYSRFKLSIDTQSDLDQVRDLFRKHGLPHDFSFEDLIAVLSALSPHRSAI